MNEKNAPKSMNAATSAATIVRFLRETAGTSGDLDRDSTRTNVASMTAAAAKIASVLGDVHPCSTPRLRP